MRFAIAWLVTAACPWLAACSGDEARATLELELAPSPAMGSETCPLSPAALEPSEAGCVRISICRDVAGVCETVPLARPSGDHRGGGQSALGIVLDETRRISFDAMAGPGPHNVSVVVYGQPDIDGNAFPIAAGQALGVPIGGDTPIRVRLYRYARMSCAGPRRTRGRDAQPLPRALHHAIALPNGDVLIVGGIASDAITAARPEGGAPLQRPVEVYRVSDERFVQVASADNGVGRVFSAAQLLPGSPGGPYRIRLVGGFTTTGSDPVVRFDAIQGFTVHGSPVLATVNAEPAEPVDLVYDPSTRRLQIETPAVSDMLLPRAGFNDATGYGELLSETSSTVLLGITGGPGLAETRPTTDFAGVAVNLDTGGQPIACSGGDTHVVLANARWGGTVTRVRAGSPTSLIWGGNVNEGPDGSWLPAAGELVTEGSCATTPVAGGGVMPDPTAYHTATPFQGGHIILAGGLLVNGREGSALQGFSRAYAQFDPGLGRGSVISVLQATGLSPPEAPFASLLVGGSPPGQGRILHTATALRRATAIAPDGTVLGSEEVVMIVGGATSMPGRSLAPLGEVVTVKFDGSSFVVVPVFDSAPPSPLIQARWGHAAAPLPQGRLLITGGLRTNVAGDQLQTISTAEVFAVNQQPPPIRECEIAAPDAGMEPPDTGLGASDAGM